MAMLNAPPADQLIIAASTLLCACFAFIFSFSSIWEKFFPKNMNPSLLYLKVGEYGETDLDNKWSVFKEPLNALTSLSYSLFGMIIFFYGINDFSVNDKSNRIITDPLFSLAYGGCCIYLGIASFLFHASHTEVWRKADAGMTSGVVIPLLTFAIWDRSRPPAMSAPILNFLGLILLISLTSGYLPYGSSDVLVPSFVAIGWILELAPRYGGVVDNEQYKYWLQSFLGLVGGMLLRAIDIKRKQISAKNYLFIGYGLVVFGFGLLIGLTDFTIIICALSGLIVYKYPERGHICWHIFSSFALYNWWHMMRIRPGDPSTPFSADSQVISIIFFIGIKNGIRRIFMNIPAYIFPTTEIRDKTMFFFEHLLFTIWGLQVIILTPGAKFSWFYNPKLCWIPPLYPTDEFRLFYIVKVATHIEDLLYLFSMQYVFSHKRDQHSINVASTVTAEVNLNLPPSDKDRRKDAMMDIHHLATAILCISSFFTGYVKIGSLVMLLHDASDVPLDVLRLFMLKGYNKTAQSAAYITTLIAWLFWRLWVFPMIVIRTIMFDSKSILFACEGEDCVWMEALERAPFVVLLGALLLLHILWFKKLLQKGYRELFCCEKSTVTAERIN
eukprot:gene4807-6735_t